MKAMSLEQTNVEAARWLRFLSRWALVTALMGIVLVVVSLLGGAPSDNALGREYNELLRAVRTPVIHSVSTTLEALVWLMMGGTLLTLAVILSSRAPIRALLIAACGIGMFTGLLGAFMRLVGISDLAAQYAVATPAQQSALLQSVLALRDITEAHYTAADLLAGAGYLLVASATFALAAVPRWLTVWLVLAGVLGILLTTRAYGVFSNPLLFLGIVVEYGLHAAIAVAFWRPSPALVSATASA